MDTKVIPLIFIKGRVIWYSTKRQIAKLYSELGSVVQKGNNIPFNENHRVKQANNMHTLNGSFICIYNGGIYSVSAYICEARDGGTNSLFRHLFHLKALC